MLRENDDDWKAAGEDGRMEVLRPEINDERKGRGDGKQMKR